MSFIILDDINYKGIKFPQIFLDCPEIDGLCIDEDVNKISKIVKSKLNKLLSERNDLSIRA